MFDYVNFLRSPKAEKDEDYGIDYVILEEHGDTLTVAARGVSPVIDGDWEIYEVERLEDLFDVVPEPGGGEWK